MQTKLTYGVASTFVSTALLVSDFYDNEKNPLNTCILPSVCKLIVFLKFIVVLLEKTARFRNTG